MGPGISFIGNSSGPLTKGGLTMLLYRVTAYGETAAQEHALKRAPRASVGSTVRDSAQTKEQ